MKELVGTGVALCTPFNENGSIDFISLEKLVNYVIDNGVEYLAVMGTTAEVVTLTTEEKKEVIECIIKTNQNRVPMILGIGGSNTQAIIDQIKSADLSNFLAVLSVSPSYNKPSQEGIYQHYKALSESTEANIILYNVPGRTASNLNPQTTLRLAHDFSNLIAVKDAPLDYFQPTEVIKSKPESFLVISGDDELALPLTLAGGSGVISVIGQGLPKAFSEMIRLGLKRNVDEAYSIHYLLMDITRLIFKEGNPAGIKTLLSLKGICKPYTRLPLVPASKSLTMEIEKCLSKIEL
jgi:4-hydroxy-tetrahydrodipicolinate synthase